jgi:hypothetical protein
MWLFVTQLSLDPNQQLRGNWRHTVISFDW